jgi:hypothetical protein
MLVFRRARRVAAGSELLDLISVCVFITAVPITKLFAWGRGDSGGHVLRETTSRGLGSAFRLLLAGVCVCYCSTCRTSESALKFLFA